MTDATQPAKPWPTTAHRSAGPITLGLGGLILGALLALWGPAVSALAVIIGVVLFLVGLVIFLDGVHKLVKNVDAATQALLERAAPPTP
ncbi:hypothetical protein [Promicromonospora iranensis]|uniref:Asparagine N-glycosylation enzyme membrane subunit Stt3 n=1 Tax=Promicromonospora iranensis TaxID=1105144 RepID=A0ABU2CHF7_9MICO|nr:hypothetical protein [Promicromonospora iranensis]MDR7380771.1 asparagine N-glycosylation enzyme membrane subunit Stt3 [Promicromonospora iranensis]